MEIAGSSRFLPVYGRERSGRPSSFLCQPLWELPGRGPTCPPYVMQVPTLLGLPGDRAEPRRPAGSQSQL